MISDVLNTLERSGTIGRPRLTEMGKIKIGGLGESRPTRDGGTFRIPRKDDHFTITTVYREKSGDLRVDQELMNALVQEYGDDDGKLRSIPIRVLSDDIDDIVQTAIVWYGGKTVGARSDGKTVTWFNDPKNGKKLDKPKTEPWDDKFLELKTSKGDKLFKVHTTFDCVIATKEARWGGVYKFRTTSLISLQQLSSSLVHLSQLTGGIMVGMPLMLVMRPLQVAPNGQPTTVYVVHVELRGPDILQLQQQAVERAQYKLTFQKEIRQAQDQYRALITRPGTEVGVDVEEISAEFAPGADPLPDAKSQDTLTVDGKVFPAKEEREPGDESAPTPAEILSGKEV